jgi:diaminopimelate decarboxylase
MDPASLPEALAVLDASRSVRLCGLHVHLVSGMSAVDCLALAADALGWARSLAADSGVRLAEIDLGGGMDVDNRAPGARFDWAAYGAGLARLAGGMPGVRRPGGAAARPAVRGGGG